MNNEVIQFMVLLQDEKTCRSLKIERKPGNDDEVEELFKSFLQSVDSRAFLWFNLNYTESVAVGRNDLIPPADGGGGCFERRTPTLTVDTHDTFPV